MGVASLFGLVPNGHAILLQLEVPLLLPGSRLDFPHHRPHQHGLKVVVSLDAWKRKQTLL